MKEVKLEEGRIIPATYDPVFKALLTSEECREYLQQKLEKELLEEIETKNILNKQINENVTDEYIEIEIIYEVIEEIGTNEKLMEWKGWDTIGRKKLKNSRGR